MTSSDGPDLLIPEGWKAELACYLLDHSDRNSHCTVIIAHHCP